MPTYHVTAPDGRKLTIQGDSPDGAAQAAEEYVKANPAKASASKNVVGAAATLSASIPLVDELGAALDTAGGVGSALIHGQPVSPDRIAARFNSSLAASRGAEDAFKAEHPVASNLVKGIGNATSLLFPASKLAQAPRLMNMGRGAVTAGATAALYGLTDRGTLQERLKAGGDAAFNPAVLALGAGAGALGPALAKAPKIKARTDADVLGEIGVSTSIPQRMGGMAKQAEDLAMRAPILGPVISGYRGRQTEQLVRGIALKALEPVGKSLPKNIKPGFDMVQHVDDELGSVYKQAADLVPHVVPDQQFGQRLTEIGDRRADLSESAADQFDRIIKDRLARLTRPDASGALVKKIHGELGDLQAEMARKGETTLSSMLGETRQAVMGLVARANPKAGELVHQADQGWSIYSIMNDAAASASNRGGVFLPGQLNTQVRRAGRSLGSNMTGKGKAPLQEIATAAARTLPDQFGNPGTANAVGLGGLGVGLLTSPVKTVGVAVGLGAAATPYALAARKIATSLPPGASQSQISSAMGRLAGLAQKDPAAAEVYRQVAARLAAPAGAVGYQQSVAGASSQ